MKKKILFPICFIFLLVSILSFFVSKSGRLSLWQRYANNSSPSDSEKTSQASPDTSTGNETEGTSSPSNKENSSQSAPETSTDSPSAAASTQAPVDLDSLSNSLMAWWFMRNETHSTPSAQEEIDLSNYDAWYVKTNLKEKEKPVYLTFDCGYENGYTPGILDVLKKHKAPAAFFLCKYFIKDQPDLVKRMKEEGHVVGNHTANHICMPNTSQREIREEIADCANYMKEATGYEMDHFFRPPKGEYSERTLQITKDMGYTTVFWSLAYLDYDVDHQPGSQYVIDHFSKYIHPGAIPLIHNISQSNGEALDTVLTNLEQEGYTFESLETLCQ